MSFEVVPIPILFLATIVLVVVSIEAGYKLGKTALRKSRHETDSPVSTIESSILGLLAFMLAFTFGIVTDRFEARKGLVRDEANAIGTAYLRSDFLSASERDGAVKLFREYVELRLSAIQLDDTDQVLKALAQSSQIQKQLWNAAVENARKDKNSQVAALYVDSLNKVFDIEALRVAVGLHMRIPTGIWLVLYFLVILGMIGVGYQSAIAGSERSWTIPLLALSFSVVIALIVSLDRPTSGFITVSQPLEDLKSSIVKDVETRTGHDGSGVEKATSPGTKSGG